ncbi:TPA: restriction endonuclease subunit S [Vibrio parahaemolyticus]|uniref:restriction endonuclease subunit S n=1 Tax=Vibrio parahaemolyticus TaxID=670 RepID=UPI00186A97DD|nr:restriction endonuclease subunit S [Vibrio parahaemolyticus]MBE4271866.1 restriction endonuclease subunit S [Vibrio parahaemolyticus]MBE4276592.1 restriction endonuclease subunit S [Vibrio parahaemolyticus]MCZ6249179.1 restriction endonuclease subunit S [Vibrio parahaemolyticus]MCZ6288714.1 restriction endonuclease subunit S [Vibrio parahaemolyticus]MDF4623656.1 restriction endonuclease subunit S [Vibrio parahaemolyticus]
MSKIEVVPELRFSGFNKAWTEKRLKEIGIFLGGGTPSKTNPDFWTGLIPWVSSSDITDDSIHQIKVTRFITEDAIAKSATKLVPENTILLVSRVGVGKLAVTTKTLCTSQDFANFTPSEGDVYFLAYYLKSKSTEFLKFNQGMAIQGFTKDDISNFVLYIPQDLEEQQKVADCLSSMDNLITENVKKLESLKLHKKGLMQKLFPTEGRDVPELRFDGFNESWKKKPFSKLFEIGSGKDHKHLADGDIPVYGSGGYMRSVNDYLYEGKSACIGRKGTINRPMLLDGKFWTVDTLFYTHSFKNCIPEFVYLLFQNIDWLKLNEAGGIPSLSKVIINKIEVLIPEEDEQQRIVDCVSSLDELIKIESNKIEALKEYKKGLMQKLFPEVKEFLHE